jgi:hypothetical protein
MTELNKEFDLTIPSLWFFAAKPKDYDKKPCLHVP